MDGEDTRASLVWDDFDYIARCCVCGDVIDYCQGHDDFDYIARCCVCGDVIDYCQGHGEDTRASLVWEEHDNDNHEYCHPDAGCNNDNEEE
jgi:hypothetical protein